MSSQLSASPAIEGTQIESSIKHGIPREIANPLIFLKLA